LERASLNVTYSVKTRIFEEAVQNPFLETENTRLLMLDTKRLNLR
jgi:hypothetical protein